MSCSDWNQSADVLSAQLLLRDRQSRFIWQMNLKEVWHEWLYSGDAKKSYDWNYWNTFLCVYRRSLIKPKLPLLNSAITWMGSSPPTVFLVVNSAFGFFVFLCSITNEKVGLEPRHKCLLTSSHCSWIGWGEGSMASMFLNYVFILIVLKKRITECAAHGVECWQSCCGGVTVRRVSLKLRF